MFCLVGVSFLSVQQQPRSMPAAGFENAIPAIRCLKIYALDHTATDIIDVSYYNIFTRHWLIHIHFVYLFMVSLWTVSVAYLYIDKMRQD